MHWYIRYQLSTYKSKCTHWYDIRALKDEVETGIYKGEEYVEGDEHRTGERLLLLSENQFDARLTEAGQPDAGEITTAQTTARLEKRAVAHHS